MLQYEGKLLHEITDTIIIKSYLQFECANFSSCFSKAIKISVSQAQLQNSSPSLISGEWDFSRCIKLDVLLYNSGN